MIVMTKPLVQISQEHFYVLVIKDILEMGPIAMVRMINSITIATVLRDAEAG